MRVELTLDDDRQFQPSRKVTLTGKFGERQAEIEFFRRQHGRCVLKLRGIDSISDAEKYVGADVRIPTNELLPAAEGSFYTFQLKGCRVFSAGEETRHRHGRAGARRDNGSAGRSGQRTKR